MTDIARGNTGFYFFRNGNNVAYERKVNNMDETMERIKEIYKELDKKEEEMIKKHFEDDRYCDGGIDDMRDFYFHITKYGEKSRKKIRPYEVALRFLSDIIHEYPTDEIISRFNNGIYTDFDDDRWE